MNKENKKWDKFCVGISNMFGVGNFPKCPGTAACVVAVLVFVLVKSMTVFFVITAVAIFLSYLCVDRAEELYAEKDCKKIVIDDFSGMLITMLFLPRDFTFIISAFFLFRMFDMLKVYPANKIEELHGAKGIVGDDIIAGIYGFVFIQIAIHVSALIS